MAKDKPQMDNLTLLSGRQGKVGAKLCRAADSSTGLNVDQWVDFLNFDISETVVTKLSGRTRKTLETLGRTGGYTVASNIMELYWTLFDDFAASRQEYVRRGWVALEPGEPAVRSSMTQPLEATEVMGARIEEEEDIE